jgi:bactofilin
VSHLGLPQREHEQRSIPRSDQSVASYAGDGGVDDARCRLRYPEMAAAAADQLRSQGEVGPRFTLGPRDPLEGRLTYEGSLRIEGRVEGELHLTGDVEIAHGAIVKASLEASSVAVQGSVEGPVIARQNSA